MLFDTNILIAYLGGEKDVINAMREFRKVGHTFFISSLTRAELLSLPSLTKVEQKKIKEFLREFISFPMDDAGAESAAYFRRAYGLKLPDAAIAASAHLHSVPLITRDKIFKKIKEIEVGQV